MPADTEFSRIRRGLPVVTGLVLISATFLVNILFGGAGTSAGLGMVVVTWGCVLIVLGVVVRRGRLRTALAKVSLAVLSIVCMLGLAEGAFRAVGFNFDRPNPEIPIFNQPPNLHMGGGILRRPGPASWRGKPLSSFIHFFFGNENAYPDEPTVEIRYDRLGFRNPPDLTNWEVVVTGDSFVESGYLAYEEIFTTLAAKRLGVRIKNLGVSGTGTIFQTAYVRNYGKAPATKHAVLCFFDGNDVADLVQEAQDTNYICRTGYRRGRQKQDSLVVAVHDQLWRPHRSGPVHSRTNLVPNAFVVAGNKEYPAAIWPIPPRRWEDLKEERQEIVAAALANWGQTVRSLGMQPWVMCIPDSRRVLQGLVRYTDPNHPMAQWQADEFGPHLSRICASEDIRFIDTFPALRRELEAGRVPYNLFGDVHLSALGSRVVAETLAGALSAEVQQRE